MAGGDRHLYIVSHNKKLALKRWEYNYGIELIDLENNKKTLLHRKDYKGYANIGFFTKNDELVVYITFDENSMRNNPTINLWDLKKNFVEEIRTDHDSQEHMLNFSYNKEMERLALGGLDGSVSAYSIQPLKTIWYHEKPGRTDFENDEILSIDISECGNKIAALDKKNLTVYDFKTGKQLLVYPLKKHYFSCKFHGKLNDIYLSGPELEPLKLSLLI